MKSTYLAPFNATNKQITLINPHNNKKTVVEIWANHIGQYTVRAGANSDFSYTGFMTECESIEQVEEKILHAHKEGRIFK
jgi:hypothetical protein